jgi:beta-xylosidase
MNGITEVEDLATQDLTQVGSTNVWRYVWAPSVLPIGVYYATYTLVDDDGANFSDFETLVVMDVAEGAELTVLQGDVSRVKADVELIRKIEAGRWRIDKTTDQMIFYDNDGTTPLLTFGLKGIDGLPNHINIFERDPVT